MAYVLLLLAIVVAACSPATESADTTTTPVTQSNDTVTTSSDGTQPGPDVTTTSPAEPTSDRELAPDFTLALGDGGEYTLSEGTKPVYLIFWAEW